MTTSSSSRWAIIIWSATVFVCIVIIGRTQFTADLSAFLPRMPTPVQQLLIEQLRDGVVSRLILIGIEGGTPTELAQTSKLLAADLRKQQEDFAAINNGEDVGLSKDREFLWRNRYLLSPAVTIGHFSSTALHAALVDDLQLLGSPAGVLLQRILPNDPSGEMLRLAELMEGQSRPDVRNGVWFSKDGKRALMVAQTRATGYDLDAQERALERIKSDFSNSTDANVHVGQKLLLSGPGVFSVSARARIKKDALRFSIIATTLVAALLLALYRSPRVLLLGLLPVASGALAGVTAVSLGFGAVHGITLAFGTTLIGEAVDYAIFLFTQITPGTTPNETLTRIWPTLRLGLLSSICGFGAMILSGFPGLAQLGLFSIAGLVMAAMVTRYVLPALLPPRFSVHTTASLAPNLAAIVQWASVLRYPVILAAVLALFFLAAHRGPLWSDELASLSSIAASDRLVDEQLRRDIGAPDVRHLVVINSPDQETALEASEKISVALQRSVQQGRLEGFESPDIYMPSLASQRARQEALPELPILRENLLQAQRGLPFRHGLFNPFLHDMAAAKVQPLLNSADLQGTSLALKFDSLMVKRDSEGEAKWIAMLPLRGVTDSAAIGREIELLPQAVLVDLKHESDALYQTYRREIITYSLLGTGAIVLLLLVSLRSPRRVIRVLAPLAAAVIITFSFLVLIGNPLSIFHLIGLLLVVAIGSNYALFFERQMVTAQDRERTMVSLLFANATTTTGFGLLAFSMVPVLHDIGSTVCIGAILSLAFSAILITRPLNPEFSAP